ncbi:MAG: CerR family C-terminal domain-containing protein [Propylenella sp.]
MLLHTTDSPQESTRERILDAALDLFGERGLTGATVRDIAKRAKVNVAAISYHFGGKEELYRAVATAITEGIAARIRSRAATLMDAPPADPEAALKALEALIDTVVDVIVGPPEMRRVARFLLREQMQPTAAFDIIYATMSRLHGVACRLFAAAAGTEPEAAETRLRAFMLVGQVLVLRIAEAAVQRRMGIDSYDEEFLAAAKALLKQNLRGIVAAVREARP